MRSFCAQLLAMMTSLPAMPAEHGVHIPRTNVANTLTPLHLAARRGSASDVERLVDDGLRKCDEARLPYLERQSCYKSGTVDTLGASGWAPLHEAAMNGHLEVIEYLLEKNADINVRSRIGSTPLHWAARGGHTAAARLLLDHGADLDATNYEGKSALEWAPQQQKTKVLQAWGRSGEDLVG